MPRETKAEKALRYIKEGRVEVVSANAHGLRLSVSGSRKEPYQVAYGTDANGRVIENCTCANGSEYHPVKPKCCHIECAKLLRRI